MGVAWSNCHDKLEVSQPCIYFKHSALCFLMSWNNFLHINLVCIFLKMIILAYFLMRNLVDLHVWQWTHLSVFCMRQRVHLSELNRIGSLVNIPIFQSEYFQLLWVEHECSWPCNFEQGALEKLHQNLRLHCCCSQDVVWVEIVPLPRQHMLVLWCIELPTQICMHFSPLKSKVDMCLLWRLWLGKSVRFPKILHMFGWSGLWYK